jgi:truncated hemoglobin YjbI
MKSHPNNSDDQHQLHQQPFLLERIGGSPTLKLAVDNFYTGLMHDETLSPFFRGVNVHKIRWHVYNFMSMILTWIPPEIDLNDYIGSRHQRLFDAGLTEEHFDRFATLFARSLQAVDCVGKAENEEAANILRSLRPIFKEGAAEARKRREMKALDKERRERFERYALPVVVAVATIVVVTLVAGKKRK